MRSNAHPMTPHASERGIALVAALLFILLSSVLVVTIMLTTTGERTQSSNTQTAKLALYAADAGVRTQQQILANLAKAKMDSCLAAWNAAGSLPSQPIISNPAAIFPAGTLASPYVASSSSPAFAASASINLSSANVGPTAQAFDYMFTITSSGSLANTGKRNVQSSGVLRLSATRGSFADFLVLTDQFTMANSGTVWFTSSDQLDGRVHTNGSFKFAYHPVFQDRVSQVGATATYYNNGGSPVVVDANNNGTLDTPDFFGGYVRGQTAIALPTNANDQWCKALGLTPSGGIAPTSSQINTQLGVPSGTPTNGGYVVHNASNQVIGGLYIQGTATVVKVYADTVTDRQYYRMSVGPNHVSVEVDPVANKTRVWNKPNTGGAPDFTYDGVPNGVMYANGGIDNLTGPDRDVSTGSVPPALAINQRALIASNGDIVLQGDLTCDLYDEKTNVLGIFSGGGAVRIGNSAPNNLNVDAFVMACGSSGEFRVDNHNSGLYRGPVNLRGGMVSRYYGAFYTWDTNGNPVTGYTRNFHYDRRGLIPPMYPTTGVFQADTPTARTIAWKEI